MESLDPLEKLETKDETHLNTVIYILHFSFLLHQLSSFYLNAKIGKRSGSHKCGCKQDLFYHKPSQPYIPLSAECPSHSGSARGSQAPMPPPTTSQPCIWMEITHASLPSLFLQNAPRAGAVHVEVKHPCHQQQPCSFSIWKQTERD